MSRVDVFYHGQNDFQFCELNADGSSGMVEAREIQRIINGSYAMEQLKEQFQMYQFELFNSWVDALLQNYQEFSQSKNLPNVAIVDYIQGEVSPEFVEFKKSFEQRGCPTVIADVRDLEYKDGTLYYNDFAINCVYRRAVTWEIIENKDQSQDFIQAYLDGNVCVVGALRSQIIHNKLIFAVLHNPDATEFLTEEEKEFIKNHIPFTTYFDVNDKATVERAIQQKDNFVLKPMDKYAAKGVYIGKDCTQKQWQEIIHSVAQQGYLLQSFCQLPKLKMAYFDDKDNLEITDFNYMIGLYCYNQRFVGTYTRGSRKKPYWCSSRIFYSTQLHHLN